MRAVPGLIAFLVGAALLGAPWWSSTLPRGDYPLAAVLGMVFAAIGVFAALPEFWPRIARIVLCAFHGDVRPRLRGAGAHAAPSRARRDMDDRGRGRLRHERADAVVGAHRCRFFAIVCLGTAMLGLWGLARGLFGRSPEGGASPPE
jgi:hypothetical protein